MDIIVQVSDIDSGRVLFVIRSVAPKEGIEELKKYLTKILKYTRNVFKGVSNPERHMDSKTEG